jgi:hypothetical protein
MNSVQFFCITWLVKARPPTTNTFRSYCLSFSTRVMKSLSPPTITNALMWEWVKGHLERVEGEVDVGAVLVAAGRHHALHHADGVLGHRAAVLPRAFPVAVRDLGDHFAAFLDRFEHRPNVELEVEGGLDADLDVVEIDKHSNLQFLIGHLS